MEEEKKNKKTIAPVVVGAIALVLLIFGASYAYFQVQTSNNFGTTTIEGTADALGSVALNGTSATLRLHLTGPDMMQDENDITYWGTSDGTPSITQNVVTIGSTQVTGSGYFNCNYTLSVTATGTNNMYTAFQGMSGKSTEQIVLKVGDTKYDFNTSSLFPITINGTLNGVTSSDVQTLTAEFYVINKEGINQDALQGTDININISATNFSCTVTEDRRASSVLTTLASTNNSCGIEKYTGKVTDRYQDYGEGVDATKVYYFTNNNCNNVVFANYCWKIIRTTETGGVKLLYNGLSTNGECNNAEESSQLSSTSAFNTSTNSPAYVGYMYNKTSGTLREMLYADDVNRIDSDIKTTVENWFSTSGINESKLEDAVYCNDRSLNSSSPYSNLDTTYTSSLGAVYFKEYNVTRDLNCTNETDAFSKNNVKAQTRYKVGLMSSPEANLMGVDALTGGQYYWLSSPIDFISRAAHVRYAYGAGFLGSNNAYGMAGVRPAVSLGTGAEITGGEGSTSNPFVVSNN